MPADDDEPGPKAYRMKDYYTAVVSKNPMKKDSPFILQVPFSSHLFWNLLHARLCLSMH